MPCDNSTGFLRYKKTAVMINNVNYDIEKNIKKWLFVTFWLFHIHYST